MCPLCKTLLAFVLLHFVLQGQTCLLLQVFLDFLLLHSIPSSEKDIFWGVSSRSGRSSLNHSTSASSALLVGAKTWITVMLNGLPWKQTEIILSFLRLLPSTTFQILLLSLMATPFFSKGVFPTLVDMMVI